MNFLNFLWGCKGKIRPTLTLVQLYEQHWSWCQCDERHWWLSQLSWWWQHWGFSCGSLLAPYSLEIENVFLKCSTFLKDVKRLQPHIGVFLWSMENDFGLTKFFSDSKWRKMLDNVLGWYKWGLSVYPHTVEWKELIIGWFFPNTGYLSCSGRIYFP